jgi:hypothetical protein
MEQTAPGRPPRRRSSLDLAVLPLAGSAQAASDPCGSGSNPIVCENSKTGSPMSDWYSPNAYGDIKGFSTKESVQAGDTVQFKIQSPVSYNVQIYRLGWYGGDGARLISTAAQAAVTYPANYTTSPPVAPPSPPAWSTAATGP